MNESEMTAAEELIMKPMMRKLEKVWTHENGEECLKEVEE